MVYGLEYDNSHLVIKSKITREKEEGILYQIYFRRFGADNYAVFNEDEKLVRIECHPIDKNHAKYYVDKNLKEFIEQVKEMKIPKGISYDATDTEYFPEDFT